MTVSRNAVLGFVCVALAAAFAGADLSRHESARDAGNSAPVTIDKQPVNFTTRTFDPANPPSDMPAFSPGEEAVCDSNFLSNVTVDGRADQSDSTHETITITHVAVTLQLNVTIWVPTDASQHVIEHENGHRRISEYFYATADKVAGRIAQSYIGQSQVLTGSDLDAQYAAFLKQTGSDIAAKYGDELNPEPAQQQYDIITDYSRNGVAASDAVDQALKGAAASPSAPGN
jgi:hypothetical protein